MNTRYLSYKEINGAFSQNVQPSYGGVGDHAAGAHDLGQVAARHHSGWLVVDATLEARGAPGQCQNN